jgi:hypothetical protein
LVAFNSYEIASRLSFGLWATMPDSRLFTLAEADELRTSQQIAAEARRMLADPKIKDGLRDFHLQWLRASDLGDVVKDPAFTAYTPAVAAAMLDETAAFVADVFAGDGKLRTLLTAPRSFLDGGLAAIYGVSGVTGPGLRPVSLDPTQRAGVFTQGSFLAAHADGADPRPIMRGTAVLGSLLCIALQEPADVQIPPVPERPPGQSQREQWQAYMQQNACGGSCHGELIDPVGFAFGRYDAVGAYRTQDGARRVDASGTLTLGGQPLIFDGAVDLATQLAGRREVADCMATQWLRYLLRRADDAGDQPSLDQARARLRETDGDLRELLIALTGTRAFTHRSPSEGEPLP